VNDAVVWLTIFVLSVFVGIEVISKVSSTLHTPLMSGANVPAQMPGPASRLYAQNVVNLVTLMTRSDDDGAAFAPDFEDEIVAGSCVTHDGAVLHEPTRTALEGDPA